MQSNMQGLSYLAGKHYCVLLIPTEKAHRHGLDNEKNVIIEETNNSIVITNKIEGGDHPQPVIEHAQTYRFAKKDEAYE